MQNQDSPWRILIRKEQIMAALAIVVAQSFPGYELAPDQEIDLSSEDIAVDIQRNGKLLRKPRGTAEAKEPKKTAQSRAKPAATETATTDSKEEASLLTQSSRPEDNADSKPLFGAAAAAQS